MPEEPGGLGYSWFYVELTGTRGGVGYPWFAVDLEGSNPIVIKTVDGLVHLVAPYIEIGRFPGTVSLRRPPLPDQLPSGGDGGFSAFPVAVGELLEIRKNALLRIPSKPVSFTFSGEGHLRRETEFVFLGSVALTKEQTFVFSGITTEASRWRRTLRDDDELLMMMASE